MAENTKLSVSETTMRKLLDFTKGEWLTLGSIAKQLGVNVETLADWGRKGSFPVATQMSKEGWRLIPRLSLLQWFKNNGTPNADDYATFKQKWFNTREIGDATGLRPEKVLDYLDRGIIKSLDSNTGHKQYEASQVDILKSYLLEQRTKEDKSRADAKEFNKSEAIRLNKEQVEKNKWKEEMQAEIEARRKSSIAQKVADYAKSLGG